MAATSVLTWSKLVWGAKTVKGTVLRSLNCILFYFILLEDQNHNLLILTRPKLLLSLDNTYSNNLSQNESCIFNQ